MDAFSNGGFTTTLFFFCSSPSIMNSFDIPHFVRSTLLRHWSDDVL
jgi:hypothetical protein